MFLQYYTCISPQIKWHSAKKTPEDRAFFVTQAHDKPNPFSGQRYRPAKEGVFCVKIKETAEIPITAS